MWGRFGHRRTNRGEALKQAIGALGNVRGRFGWRRAERGGGAYNKAAVGLGIGAVVMVILITLLLLQLRRRATRKTSAEAEVLPQVRDLMTSAVVSVEPSTSIAEAAQRMIEQEKGPLPVVEGERPVAMLTDRDILAKVVAVGRDPGSVAVNDIATRELVTVEPDQGVDEAARLMDEQQLDRILVVEGERLVGIISEADIRLDEGPLA